MPDDRALGGERVDRSVAPPPWPHPVPLGRRLCWFDGANNVTIPLVEAQPIHPGDDLMDRGWHAHLPTENGVHVDLTWDPGEKDGEVPENEQVSLWLYVAHPEFGHLIEASIQRFDVPGEGVRYWVEYDPDCGGPACDLLNCSCRGDTGQWWEYVSDGPQHVLERLQWLGALALRVPDNGRDVAS